eukprot:c31368_g1_i1.p1 GENE.c31368_g1_i1~~c31368_g1_i1.p1  ORF type:complete len:285 (-),score=63.92 c31368_g1_i1:57-911(-)
MAIQIILSISMFFFDDTKTPQIPSVRSPPGTPIESDCESSQITTINSNRPDPNSFQERHRWAVPYLLFIGFLIYALGDGLIVKFIPLYFANDCNLSPTQVQIIYVILPVFLVAGLYLAERLATKIGRVLTIILCRGLGAISLFGMVFLPQYTGDWRLMAPLYVAHAVIGDSAYPLEESILMDFVDKDTRGRWKSIQSIGEFGWSGTAVLGGILADDQGYTTTILITALIECFAALFFLLLIPLVPIKEGGEEEVDQAETVSTHRTEQGSFLFTEGERTSLLSVS